MFIEILSKESFANENLFYFSAFTLYYKDFHRQFKLQQKPFFGFHQFSKENIFLIR